ncbi:glycosyltransferase [Proteus mirabilis]|uniref:glycosyltransferase n=1 Tax=Proteus mirabilis TaxID=584 RepID=UPI0005382C87|nr:glycosyltransferase [Proteus mirabilis]AUU37165.1 glycosyl transferase [Proteus mirabilis]AWS55900.1 glycosyl transferase [Proteus mirabilis]EKU0762684.1 glycosyltransferase [Proteus mirabilis]EKX9206057.1 glycosyltransferase [Proteus mirabilis]ELB1228611.1 glycosyltransferase [Proteus mirabilis]
MDNVAVIMSVYKNDTLEPFKISVNSILNQSYKNIDLYIYRDGIVSEKIQNYLNLLSNEKSIFIVEKEYNNGLAHALNELIDIIIAKNKYIYIARMDADDISRNKRIEKQVDYLSKNRDIDVCGTSCKEFGASFALKEKHLPKMHQDLLEFSITRCPFIHPSVMFRTAIFQNGIRYPTNTNLTEDMALWFYLLSKGYKFSNINEILLEYRINEDTLKRRSGLRKALSETRIRFYYMFKLNKVTLKLTILLFFRFLFHLLPNFAIKIIYRKMR